MISAVQNNLINAALTPAQTHVDVAVAVAAKSLDAQRQQGANIVALIDGAGGSSPPAGDPVVAQATGLGGLLDTTG